MLCTDQKILEASDKGKQKQAPTASQPVVLFGMLHLYTKHMEE